MDPIETYPETDSFETDSFGKELAKTFVLSTAASTGVWTGILVTFLTAGAISEWMKNRKAKKDQTVPPTETV